MLEKQTKSLTKFIAHEKPFPERLVDALFKIEYTGIREGGLKSVFTTGGYVPEINEVKSWAASVIEAAGFEKPHVYEDREFYEGFYSEYIYPFNSGEVDLITAKADAIRAARDYFGGSAREHMFGDGPTDEAWFACHAYMFCETIEKEAINGFRESRDDQPLPEREITVEELKASCEFCANLGVAIGFLRRDAWWKFNHEQAAIAHYEQMDARQRGSAKGGSANASRYDRLKGDCLAYLAQAYEDYGNRILCGRADVVGALVREIALRERPDDFVGPNKNPLTEKWFRETFEDFQSGGEFGEAIAELLK